MNWVVLSYSLPSQSRSSVRVGLWRRLRRLGVVSLAGGSHLLPARDECVEAFQWLAQEIRQARGEAVVMRVEQIDDMTDQHIVELFHAARREDYAAIEAEAAALEKTARAKTESVDRAGLRDSLDKLRRRQADVARVDYFDCPEGSRLASRLAHVEELLSPGAPPPATIAPAAVADYRNKRWVTRPRPHVDRLACIWLIRRFVDPRAVVRYAARPEPDEIAFDMGDGQFGHQGNLCTFETMQIAFGLEEPGLHAVGEIVHEIDLRDSRYTHPETEGIDTILKGWLLANLSDSELEAHGIALFEGLYRALSSGRPSRPQAEKQAPKGGRSHG